ncbi:hypothetical protein J6590_063083 [Homalodisca vitripennis]|nr:hypothetical protein J6590_063083 [Homalodisca vitripennis]
MVCRICSKPIPGDGDYVECRKCKAELHYHCAGLQKSTWKAKPLKKKSECECSICKPSTIKTRSGSVEQEDEIISDDPTYLALKKFLGNMFKRQEEKISSRTNTIVTLVNKLEDTINNLIDRMHQIETNSFDLRREMEDLRLELEC